jgi:hypothetical protein
MRLDCSNAQIHDLSDFAVFAAFDSEEHKTQTHAFGESGNASFEFEAKFVLRLVSGLDAIEVLRPVPFSFLYGIHADIDHNAEKIGAEAGAELKLVDAPIQSDKSSLDRILSIFPLPEQVQTQPKQGLGKVTIENSIPIQVPLLALVDDVVLVFEWAQQKAVAPGEAPFPKALYPFDRGYREKV